ncbi:MAG: transketolase C-terminal domain-containing protein [Planctomycetota bacterium]|jgi:pyruvate dehydrogenase E1 component beta subunit
MAKTVAETIKEITRKHLNDNNGLLFGQAIAAVGWVNNTVPNCKNIVEFPMSDVSNMGIACGAAIAGRRPIIVIRFQDFLWLNSSTLVNYAAKSKDIMGTPTPVFVRALAQENAGCVHSGILHSVFMHMPGFRVCSPMTPKEYEEAWDDFMAHDDPMIVSEHRASFGSTREFSNSDKKADITLMPISAARFNVDKAAEQLNSEGIKCNVAHVMWLKPLRKKHLLSALANSRTGLVIDATFEICGAAQSIAYELMLETGKGVRVLGLEDRSIGVSFKSRNETPSAEKIVAAAKDTLC